MLSRSQSLSQLFILEKLYDQNWKVSQSAMAELEGCEHGAINKQDIRGSNDLIIMSVNTRSLRKHYPEIQRLHLKRNYNMILLQETWLHATSDPSEFAIDKLFLHSNSVGLGKGVASYCTQEFVVTESITKNDCQVIKTSSKIFDVINVYRSSSCKNFSDLLTSIIDTDRKTIICGDTNMDVRKNEGEVLCDKLAAIGFEQLLTKASHVEGGLIDQVFVNDHLKNYFHVKINQISNRFRQGFIDNKSLNVDILAGTIINDS